MPREKKGYRNELERICEKYPNKEMLNIGETMKYLGLSRAATKKMVKFNSNKYVSKSDLAGQICGG